MDKIDFDEQEILKALTRSGYLFESEISKFLIDRDYFVETNKVIKDNLTGKSRELDIIAEKFEFRKFQRDSKCLNRLKFVFEIKNTSAPLVLLTEFQNSELVFDFDALKHETLLPEGLEIFSNKYWEEFIYNKKFSIFTQYCSFQKKSKNDELMALHPDNIYSGLSKICQYCEEQLIRFREMGQDDYLRSHLYLPALLISDDLYELTLNEKTPKITKSNCSILLYNYHFQDIPRMAYIFVVTRDGLDDFTEFANQIKRDLLDEYVQKRIEASHNPR